MCVTNGQGGSDLELVSAAASRTHIKLAILDVIPDWRMFETFF